MKADYKHDRSVSLIQKLIAEYIARESGRQSLITVTNVLLSDDRKYATILLSVFPQTEEEKALALLKRHASSIRSYIKEHARLGSATPFLNIKLDDGEKNRQRIDELSRE